MKKITRKVFIFFLFMMIIVSFSIAEKIYLKSGEIIEGKIVSYDTTSVTIDEPILGILKIPRKEIDKIVPPLEEKEFKKRMVNEKSIQQIAQKEEKKERLIIIVLKDGREIKGKFLSENIDSITIETEMGMKTIKKEFIMETKPPFEAFRITKEEREEKRTPEKLEIEPPAHKEALKEPFRESEFVQEEVKKARRRIPLTFHISGDYNFINGEDLNKVISGKAELYSDSDDYFDWGELKNMYDFNFEIIYNISKYIGLGIGVGYLTKKNQGKYGWEEDDGDYNDYSREYKISALVFSGNIHGNIPLGKIFNIVLSGGGDYYLGKLNHEKIRDWDYHYLKRVLWYSVWTWWGGWTHYYYLVSTRTVGNSKRNEDASCNTIGFHGGIGLDINISSNFSFVVEGLYRYVKFKNYFGKYEYNSSSGSSSNYEGNLWYYGTDYPEIMILEDQPSEGRKAEINLSGFSIRAGVKVRF